MKPTSIMPAIMAAESFVAAVVYVFHGKPLMSIYWLGATIINLAWVWL